MGVWSGGEHVRYNGKMHQLEHVYRMLFCFFGPQRWWPGKTPFEIAIGAILTQNTNWTNVERAIENLKRHGVLSPKALYRLSGANLASLVRPAGYYRVKARRIRCFLEFLFRHYGGRMEDMAREETDIIREKLLEIHGIGPETADSILLYALEKPVFVIDAYTRRVLARHGIMAYERSYEAFQQLFHSAIVRDVRLYNEYHALFVRLGKTFCRARPQCDGCPLRGLH